MSKADIKLSKKMAHALRHEPEAYELNLDKNGWVNLGVFCKALSVKRTDVIRVVDNSDKKRYEIKNDLIRAVQGHSSKQVDLEFTEVKKDDAPKVIYHGTKVDILDILKKEGLRPQSRHYVHLSKDLDTATAVANRRRGKNVILEIDVEKLLEKRELFQSKNGVYLTKLVEWELISKINWCEDHE